MDALSTLPKEIHSTYDEALDRIDKQGDDDRELAYEIFMWLTHTVQPLSVKQLQHALACNEDTEEMDEDALTDPDILTSVCAGLVVIDIESQVIRLVRKSS